MNRRGDRNWRGSRPGRGFRGRGRGRGGSWNNPRNNEQSRPQRGQNLGTPVENLSEHEVGITEYLSPLPGITGIIKARFSDFHVNEIDLDGEVCKLTDTKIPPEFVKGKLSEPPKETPLEDIEQTKWDDILSVLQSEGKSVKLHIDDKEKRGVVHKKIKEIFGQAIVSSTIDEDGKKYIEVKKFDKQAHRKESVWPTGLGEYVHFLMYKENWDTMDAVNRISEAIRIKPSSFNYAGVKDRRAKTTQWISVRKLEPWKLLIKTKTIKSIRMGNMKFKDKPLKLGQLTGNRFQIALRNVTVENDVIGKALNHLNEHGFINYYGLQRFGSDREVPTHEVGVKLLQGKWAEACNLILKPRKHDDPISELCLAKKVYKETSNAKLALQKINRDTHLLEVKLLQGMSKLPPTDYVNALESIPRNMRLLYLHAFQSVIWNQVVSKRVKQFGLIPIVGDIVLIEDDRNGDTEIVLASEDKAENGESKESDIESKETKEENKERTEEDIVEESCHQKVKVLTETDLPNYTIFDIVLPMPGYDVVYPENLLKNYYKELLSKYGLTLEMPRQKVKTYNLSGSYRRILSKVSDLSWKTLKYDGPNDTLIRSDFEELLGHSVPADKPEGQYKALILSFNLSSSSYATMVLREILKIDTSTRSQSKLNDYHATKVVQESEDENPNSLLKNKESFDAFKKAIFDATGSEEPVKRKVDEIAEEDGNTTKKMKTDEDQDVGIKIQASLV